MPRAPGVPSCSLSSSCSRASRCASAISPSADERLDRLGAPAREHRVAARRARRRGPRPGARRPARPRAGAARAAAGRGSAAAAAWRALPRGGAPCWPAAVSAASAPGQVVGLHQHVDEERQAPQHGRRRGHGQLVLEGQPGVRLGVADLARPDERHRPEHAAVRERDQPAARARDVDERVAQRQRGLQLVVGDEASPSRRSPPASLARQPARPGSSTGRSSAWVSAAGWFSSMAQSRRRDPPQLERRRPRRALAHVTARTPRSSTRAPCRWPRARPRAARAVRPGRPRPARAPDGRARRPRRKRPIRPESPRAVQGDRAALDGGDRGGDRLVQQVVGVGLHVRGERETELEPDVRLVGGAGRRLGDRAAQVRRRALRGAARAGPPRRLAQRRRRSRPRVRARCAAGAARCAPGRPARSPAARRRRRAGAPARPLACSCTACPRSADGRASVPGRRSSSPAARSASAARAAPAQLEPGQPGGMAQRRAGPEHRHGAGQRPGAVGQPRELDVRSRARPAQTRTSPAAQRPRRPVRPRRRQAG